MTLFHYFMLICVNLWKDLLAHIILFKLEFHNQDVMYLQ